MIANAEQIKEAVSIRDVLAMLDCNLDSRNKCACPVHGGKDKNFSVIGEIGTCFSQCGGKTWDAVGLLMEIQNLTYPEALEELAKIGKLNVEYTNNNRTQVIEQAKLERSEKERLINVIKRVANGYWLQQNYPGIAGLTEVAIDKNRTYKIETIYEFGLFYSGQKPILQKSFSSDIEDLIKLSLVKKKDMSMYEPFVNRTIYPIYDENGVVVAFAGRKMEDDNSEYAKWINSGESLIYNKSEILYGLHKSKHFIKKQGAILVEGYGDFLTLWDNGIKNAVASCGTAFTFQQAKKLKKYTEKVTLLYDGDDAGVQAARKASEI